MHGELTVLPKWEPKSRNRLYIGRSPFHAVLVVLILNIITGHISPQYYVLFDETFSTVDHMRKGTVFVNWTNLVEQPSELTRLNFTLK